MCLYEIPEDEKVVDKIYMLVWDKIQMLMSPAPYAKSFSLFETQLIIINLLKLVMHNLIKEFLAFIDFFWCSLRVF